MGRSTGLVGDAGRIVCSSLKTESSVR